MRARIEDLGTRRACACFAIGLGAWLASGVARADLRGTPAPAPIDGATSTPTNGPSASNAPVPAAPAAPFAAAPQDAPAAPQEPWHGTLAQGFDEIRSLAARGQFESARKLCDALLLPTPFLRAKEEFHERGGWRRALVRASDPALDWLGWNGPSAATRAEIVYSRGVVGLLARERAGAEDDFHRARGAAGSRALADDALYDVGWLAFDAGEEARAQLPEISGKPAAPAPPVAAPPGGQAPPDPLQVARAAYVRARGVFVERLKSDWRDADTQANVELCLRRLRELDAIEKKREEEKQKQEQQQKQDPNQQKQDPQQKSDPDKSKDPKDSPPEGQDPKKDPKDQPQDPKPEDPSKKPPAPEPKPDESKPADEPKTPKPTEAKEGQMSREEITQLLDRLQRLEEESRRIQAAMKAARRGKVKKDW